MVFVLYKCLWFLLWEFILKCYLLILKLEVSDFENFDLIYLLVGESLLLSRLLKKVVGIRKEKNYCK